MISNFLKITIRNLIKYKGYSFINISGLALGIACTVFILMYVVDELTYDAYHENADNIVRLVFTGGTSDRTITTPSNPPAPGPTFMEHFPQVENFVRFNPGGTVIIKHEDKQFEEDKFFWADSSVFNVFTYKFLRGAPETALMRPNVIVITERTATKYFGSENPIGEVLEIIDVGKYEITAVIENLPENSHFTFDLLASYATLKRDDTEWMNNFSNYTYFKLNPNLDLSKLEQDLPAIVEDVYGEQLREANASIDFVLQRLRDIHLHSDYEFEIEPNGNIMYVYIFAAVAFFVLLIACINFMNLTTAKSANRAKEVGLRKVSGATKQRLINQFLAESVFMTVIAAAFAMAIVAVLLPYFNNIAGKSFEMSFLSTPGMMMAMVGMILVVGFGAGSYPAFFLSSFEPVTVLKGTIKSGAKSSMIRNVLVISQFAVSVVFIIGSLIIFDQLSYVRNKDLGFDKEQVLVFRMRGQDVQKKFEAIKSEMLANPQILNASASTHLPFGAFNIEAYVPEGKEIDNISIYNQMKVDHDFLETYRMELAEGRSFSKEFPSDTGSAIIINEAAATKLGWDEPLNKEFGRLNSIEDFNDRSVFKTIGVVKDFHYESLHQSIKPLTLSIQNLNFNRMSLRLNTNNLPETMDFLKRTWAKFDPVRPFEYIFVDEEFDKLYRADERLGNVFRIFTAIAIFIASLGLFGMASFTAVQRTKEIGIRKVLGATVSQVIAMLSKDFTKLILIANVVAWPLAYYFMDQWLQGFSYRINIGVLTFVLATFLSFLLAVITVSYQAVKAAFTNPVKALKYE